MAKEAPRRNKTKEEIARDIKQSQEVTRQRTIVTGKLWPLLIKSAKSIKEAKDLLQIIQVVVRQQFDNQQRTQKLADIKIFEMIDPKADRADYVREYLDQLREEPLSVVLGLTRGIHDEIERLMQMESANRKLDTLKTDFIPDAPPKEGDKK